MTGPLNWSDMRSMFGYKMLAEIGYRWHYDEN